MEHSPSSTSEQHRRGWDASLLTFWLMAALAIPIWVAHDSAAWDVHIYQKAQQSLRIGHDPYSDAIAIQRQYHSDLLAHTLPDPNAPPPYSYVYSPLTLPVLRALAVLPTWVLGAAYWTLYVAGVLAAIWVGVWFAEDREKKAAMYLGAVACYFPGLLANGTVLSGNIAYILYGVVLLTAVIGWKQNRWIWLYLAVLLASCFKAPLLSLALIPALSARRQWLPASFTIAAGFGLFALQPLVWPSLFHHYLQAVELQFSFNHDFGCSPAGLFSQILYHHDIPYSPAGYIVYCAYAIPLFWGLVYLSRMYFQGEFPLKQWAPVLLVGVILLNPRIMEYDVAPITIPLALLLWRSARATRHSRGWLIAPCAVLVPMNAAALYDWEMRKMLDGPLVVALLLAGAWCLLQSQHPTSAEQQEATLALLNERAVAPLATQ